MELLLPLLTGGHAGCLLPPLLHLPLLLSKLPQPWGRLQFYVLCLQHLATVIHDKSESDNILSMLLFIRTISCHEEHISIIQSRRPEWMLTECLQIHLGWLKFYEAM